VTAKRLARLVRLKKLVERQKAADLATEQRRLADAEAKVVATENALEALSEVTETVDVSADELLSADRWKGHLARKLQSEVGTVAERATEVDSVRAGVREAWRERRLMEGMHGRAATAEAEEADAGERKEYEAIALSVYTRRGDSEER